MPDGTIAADAVWVNIVNLHAHHPRHRQGPAAPGARPAASGGPHPSRHDHRLVRGGAQTSDLSRLRIGQAAQILGAWRPEDDGIDVARVTVGPLREGAMISLVCILAPLVCGALLAVTGAAKLFGRQVARLAGGTVLVRLLNDGRRAALALRTVGAAELAVAAALLARPRAVVPGVATAVLGAGFVGYLGYARATAPESSCGCTARDEGPIGWRAFTRAGLVVGVGVAAAMAAAPLVGAAGRGIRRPSAASCWLAAAALVVLSDGRGPLVAAAAAPAAAAAVRPSAGGLRRAGVPVAATVELLERSLAWQAASPVVRSGLLDHWDEDGWRILRYAGCTRASSGARPGERAVRARPHGQRRQRPAARRAGHA